MNRKISWENWNTLEKDFLKKMNGYLKPEDALDEDSNGFEDDYTPEWKDYNEDPDKMLVAGISGTQNMYTPFGVFAIDSLMRPSDRWNCWVANTNFNLSADILNVLDKDIEGIAALNFIDRYTFCIGIGKMFNQELVKKEIEERLLKLNDTTDIGRDDV